MKGFTANLLAILGGIWTSLCGVLFVGLLWSAVADPSEMTGPDRGYMLTPMIWSAALMLVGILFLSGGLRLMRKR